MADGHTSTLPQARSWQDHDLMRYLGAEAPRYTSYPSAHHFTGLTPETYEGWLRQLRPDQSVALYLHIPFCEQMCHFCGCHTRATRRYEPVATYVATLIEEINLVSRILGSRQKVHAVHFGGGSPSILDPLDMGRIFEAIYSNFDINTGAELSIELDPRRVTSIKAGAYKAFGFNRISLGVQDTDPEVQKAIGRVQPVEMIKDAVALLKSHGLEDIGIDLVYGLPGQTFESLDRTLQHVHDLDPNRIAAFSYAHVPWVKKHQTLIDTARLPDTAQKAQMYLNLSKAFVSQGYRAVGMDHYAKPSDGLCKVMDEGRLRRNFMGYCDLPNDRLLGFGASALSQLDNGIAQNVSQAGLYQKHVNEGRLPTTRGWAFRGDDRVRAAVISDLMCRFRCDVGQTLIDHGYDQTWLDAELGRLAPFIRDGLISRRARVMEFHSELRMLIRAVAATFDSHAKGPEQTNSYSKVA